MENNYNRFEQSIDLLDYPVFSEPLSHIKLAEKKQVIHTINAYSYVLSKKIPAFKRALQNSDILLPDGFPIVFLAKILRKRKIEKIAGADLFFHLMNLLNKSGGSVFFLGSTETTLIKIKERAAIDFPCVTVSYYSPPYKSSFSNVDSTRMIEIINSHHPDVVFVGMTAPKQETWVDENKKDIHARAICSIGAVFDFYSSIIKRAPLWMIKYKLEWFYRLIKEPKRMWKRYFFYSPQLMFDVINELVKIRKNR